MDIKNLSKFNLGPKEFPIPRFNDSRGSFEVLFDQGIVEKHFSQFPELKQWNIIRAKKNSLRGFHGAKESENHWKVVSCLAGEVREAYLDIRPSSINFGEVVFFNLNAKNLTYVVIPPGFAHAFESLIDNTVVLYGTNILHANQNEIDISLFNKRWSEIWSSPVLISDRDKKSLDFDTLKNNGSF